MQVRTRRAPRARPKVAEPVRGSAFSITDEAIAKIETHVAAHEPERGGVLIVPRDSRVVVDFLPDPRAGEQVSYWHSDALRRLLADYLERHDKRRYVGTLHSHPGGYAEPSGPDHDAFATTMASNPSVRETLFPIVVRARRDELGPVLRLGEDHLVDLDGGTLAAYCAVPREDGVVVRPAPIHVVPLRADIDAATALASATTGRVITAGSTREMEVEGRFLPAVPVDVEGAETLYVAFPETYPTQPPLVIPLRSSLGPARSPGWSPDADAAATLAAAVADVVGAAEETGQIAEITARLTYHLPFGVPSRFLVIGAGSVGSQAAELLVRSGARDIAVVDFDTVEAANLSRTVYSFADIGRPKVDALADRLRAINPEVAVTGIDTHVQDLDLAMLQDVDVAVLASDDMAAEFWLMHHLYHRGVRAVSIKMFERGDAGEVIAVDPSRGTPCLRCLVGDPAASGGSGRGTTDYGTGRLVAAPALGADIVATVARGVRVALALGQSEGPLAEWIAPMLDAGRVYFQHASIADWKQISHFRPGGTSFPFDAIWAAGAPQPDCGVCGTEPRTPADAFAPTMPAALPPGVVADVPTANGEVQGAGSVLST